MQTGKWIGAIAIVGLLAAGCEESSYTDYSQAPLSEALDHGHDHGHDHGGHAGKHGGHVLELDDAHGHHAEMLFDTATRDVTLYFYGSEIGVATPATGLAFEIKKGESEVVLEAKASPLEGETAETSSRFVIAGSQLPEDIKAEEQLDGHFHVTIGGKELVGNFHAHSHDDHSHAEHGHDNHAHGEPVKTEAAKGSEHSEHAPGGEKPVTEKSGEATPSEPVSAETPKSN